MRFQVASSSKPDATLAGIEQGTLSGIEQGKISGIEQGPLSCTEQGTLEGDVDGVEDVQKKRRKGARGMPRMRPFKTTDGRGWGLLALENINCGQFVGEYCGDLLDADERDRRLEYYRSIGEKNYYMLALDGKRYSYTQTFVHVH